MLLPRLKAKIRVDEDGDWSEMDADLEDLEDMGATKEWSEYWIEFSPQTSRGSFSAVSTPIFASKYSLELGYSLESSRRDLHKALLCTVLQSQNFSQKSSTFFRDWIIEFPIFSFFSSNFAFFLRNFDEFFSGFRAELQERVRSVAFQSNLRERIRKLPKFLKILKINILNYSILFNFIQSCP